MGARALIALAIAVPWLALVPIANGAVTVALFACTLAASFHGWGLVVARRREVEPVMAILWGIAAAIALGGLALALGHDTLVAQVALVFGGVAIHTVVLAKEFRPAAARLRAILVGPRAWVLAVVLLAAIGALAILGAAGDLGARPFDGDGNLVGELRGLADTGALGDPRAVELGGHVVLSALANVAGDPRLVRMLDALGLVIALALTVSRIRPREASAGIWAALVVVTASALAISIAGPAPTWIGAGLVLALFAPAGNAVATGLVAGALVALRLAYVPVAIAGIAWSARRGRGALASAGIALAVVVPYLIARWHTSAAVGGFSVKRILGGPVLLSLALACALGLAIQLARHPDRWRTAAALTALVLCVLIHEGRDTAGRASWYRRTIDLFDSASYLAHTSIAPRPDLDAILDGVPAGQTVALWMPEPERIDHARHRIVDLRTPEIARLREHRWDGKPSRIAELARDLRVRFLLVAVDDAAAQRRQQNLFEHFACAPPAPPLCDDSLEVLLRHPIAARDGLVLVELP